MSVYTSYVDRMKNTSAVVINKGNVKSDGEILLDKYNYQKNMQTAAIGNGISWLGNSLSKLGIDKIGGSIENAGNVLNEYGYNYAENVASKYQNPDILTENKITSALIENDENKILTFLKDYWQLLILGGIAVVLLIKRL